MSLLLEPHQPHHSWHNCKLTEFRHQQRQLGNTPTEFRHQQRQIGIAAVACGPAQCAPVVSTPSCSWSHIGSSCRTYLQREREAAAGSAWACRQCSLLPSRTTQQVRCWRLLPSAAQEAEALVGPTDSHRRTGATWGPRAPAGPQVEGPQRALAGRAAAAPLWAHACSTQHGEAMVGTDGSGSGGGGGSGGVPISCTALLIKRPITLLAPVHVGQAAPQALRLGFAHPIRRQGLAGGPGGRRQCRSCCRCAPDHLQAATAC